MSPFRTFFTEMIRHERKRVLAGLACAFVSAGGLGGGLLALAAPLRLLLDPNSSATLRSLLAEGAMGFTPPPWMVGWVPEETWAGVLTLFGVLLVVTVVGSASSYAHQALTTTACVRAIRRPAWGSRRMPSSSRRARRGTSCPARCATTRSST